MKLYALLALLLAACSGTKPQQPERAVVHHTHKALPTAAGEEKPKKIEIPNMGALLLFTASVESKNPSVISDGCELVWKHGTDSFSMDISTEDTTDILDMAPGTYEASELDCGGPLHWPLAGYNFPQLTLEVGKIYFAPILHFQISDALGTLRHQVSSPKRSGALFVELTDKHPELNSTNAYSPFNGKKITRELAMKSGKPSWHANDGAPQPPSFFDCFDTEQTRNWLLLGEFRLNAVYKDKKFVSATRVGNDNTYNDAFLSCVEATLAKFTPKKNGELHYDISL